MPRTPVSVDISGQLLFLGTGTSHGVPMVGCDCEVCTGGNPKNNRMRCGAVVGLPQGNLLIDTPVDLRSQLLREKIGLVQAVVYTHEHADHLFGLDDLRLFPHYTGEPVPVYCEPRVEHRIRQSFSYVFDAELQAKARDRLPQLQLLPLGLEPVSILGAQVLPIRLWHGDMAVLGFRIGHLAYCTDTNRIPDESWPRLQGLDVLILDCLRPDPHPTHFSLAEAIETAQRIGARRTLFTHMTHNLDHDETNRLLPAGMELAYDGLRVPLTGLKLGSGLIR